MRLLITGVLIFLSIFFICFIVLWLDYYFVFPSDAMLAAVKRYEVPGSARSHGTFHLLNLHQNIQQKPPPPRLPTADTVTSQLRARYLKCKINIWLLCVNLEFVIPPVHVRFNALIPRYCRCQKCKILILNDILNHVFIQHQSSQSLTDFSVCRR